MMIFKGRFNQLVIIISYLLIIISIESNGLEETTTTTTTIKTTTIKGNKEEAIKHLVASDKPSYINLKSILEHQQALEAECTKYHEAKLYQLEQLLKFNKDNDERYYFPRPVPVKVPAVCLFLFSEFSQAAPMQINNNNADELISDDRNKLELVNWIYNEDEIRLRMANVSKREVEIDDNNNNHLLSGQSLLQDEYFFERPIHKDENSSQPSQFNFHGLNEIPDDEERIKLHENVEKILADKQFKQMIEDNKHKLADSLSPVILVPGLLGSRLEARSDKKKRVNVFCSKQHDWQDMWLSIRRLLPLAVDCWLDNVRLDYDPTTGYSKPPMGVQTRVSNFGSVESVRHLDLNQPKMTRYMAPLIERYEQLGYTPNLNLFAAPYDFRLAPQELKGYFEDLAQLVKHARKHSGSGKRVTLVCHSMGCTHLLIFLRSQTKSWRQSHIRKLIALSSPWGGAIKALKALIVGDQLELPLVSEVKMRKLARTYPSIAYLLPQAEIFARSSMNQVEVGGPVLVRTPEKVYKVNDIEQLFKDLNLTKQLKWYKETTSLIKPLEPLEDVEVDCIHSINTPTPETLIFSKQSEFPDGEFELIKGMGDGTVNLESLLVCQDWAKMLPDKVSHKIIQNTNHLGVLSHKLTLTHIMEDAYSG